jgi:hypothetical protein
LAALADEAHKAGQIKEEITYRQQFSQMAWKSFTLDPKSLDRYDRYNIILLNDLPLGLLLQGAHRWQEAEAMFRHNQAELDAETIAGNDIKSENQLHLAHLLASEGKTEEAKRICTHWKGRMRHIAAGQDSDHWHGIPRAPLYDTPEVEIAEWDLACGKSEVGIALLAGQIAAHPKMLISYTVLSSYYDSQGDFQRATKTERDGITARVGH